MNEHDNLPPLPESFDTLDWFPETRAYTADQMRDYARAALAAAQPAQAEPVAYVDEFSIAWIAERSGKPGTSITTKLSSIKSSESPVAIYTAPPQHLTLSDERITEIFQKYGTGRAEGFAEAARAVLAAAQEKQT